MSDPFRVAEFHSSPEIVGKHLTISDRIATVIGVLPAGFTFPGLSEPPSFWGTFLRATLSGVSASGMPQKESVDPLSERTDRTTRVTGRLRRGVNVAQALAELTAVQRSLAERYPEDRNAYGVEIRPLPRTRERQF